MDWPFTIFGVFGLGAIGWKVVRAPCTMEMKMRGGGVIRYEDRPIAFSLIVASSTPFLAVLHLVGIVRCASILCELVESCFVVEVLNLDPQWIFEPSIHQAHHGHD